MRIMPRAAPCEWAQEELWLNQTWKCISGLWRLSTTCTWLVKTLHNVYLACEDSPFALCLVLFLSSWLLLYVDFVCSFLFLSVTNRRLRSVLDSAKHVRCGETAAVHVTHEFLSVHVSASSKCKFDIPERDRHVRTYVRMYIARIDPSFKASR